MRKSRPEEITIFSQVSPNKTLKDLRLFRNFQKFGRVVDVANQYGIKYKIVEGGMEFSAPKSRMQMFAEKLHFADVSYVEIA